MRYKIASGKAALAMSFALSIVCPLVAHADIIALQIPNIPGDAKFATNNGLPADSIRVLTVGNSVEFSGGTGGGGSVGKAIFSNLSIVKKFGESSAPLFLSVATGRFVPSATVSFYRVKQGVPVRYYTILLDDVSVRSQKWVGNANGVDGADAENIELAYSRIRLRDEESGVTVCYDIKTLSQCQ
ncbi:MAG: type VI secretion system tube protein Hcp [Steroidobacteraceae bacterium]